MSGKGSCYDNSMVETVFKTIKSQLICQTVFHTYNDAIVATVEYIDGFYNPVCRHSALGYKSPIAFEAITRKSNAEALQFSGSLPKCAGQLGSRASTSTKLIAEKRVGIEAV